MRALRVIVVLLGSFVLTSPAAGALVELRPAGTIDEEPVTDLRLVAAAGEASGLTLTVTRDGRDRQGSPSLVLVEDPAAVLQAGAGCLAAGEHAVRCRSADEIGEIRLVLGDGNDRAVVRQRSRDQFIFTTTIDGGPGDDVLWAGDGGEIAGGPGNDVLLGSGRYESMDGGPGRDTLFGAGSGDFLVGGPGDDVLHGGTGSDDLIGGTFNGDDGAAGSDALFGDAGDDTLDDADRTSRSQSIGPDLLDGGPGVDAVDSYRERTAAVLVDLSRADTQGEVGEGDVLLGIEEAFGGAGDDVLMGNAEANWLDGRDGADAVSGGDGDDVLVADGPDLADSGEGDDTIRSWPDATGAFSCGGGDDRVRIDTYRAAVSVPGPLLAGDCERVASGTGFVTGVLPGLGTSGVAAFTIERFSCCTVRLALTLASARYLQLARRPVRGARVRVPLPDPVAELVDGPGIVLRAVVTGVGGATLSWRFTAARHLPRSP